MSVILPIPGEDLKSIIQIQPIRSRQNFARGDLKPFLNVDQLNLQPKELKDLSKDKKAESLLRN